MAPRTPARGTVPGAMTTLALALTLLVACRPGATSTDATTAGPFATGSPATACHPKTDHMRFILGSEALTNTGATAVTIDSITIAGADNLDELKAYVAPVRSQGTGGTTLMGIVNGPPPEFFDKSQPLIWRQRREASGAQVLPTADGTDMNMLIVVRSPTSDVDGSLQHLVVAYHDDAHSYRWDGTVTYRLAPGRSCG